MPTFSPVRAMKKNLFLIYFAMFGADTYHYTILPVSREQSEIPNKPRVFIVWRDNVSLRQSQRDFTPTAYNTFVPFDQRGTSS